MRNASRIWHSLATRGGVLVEPVWCCCAVGHITACYSRHDSDILLTLRRRGPKSDHEKIARNFHCAQRTGTRFVLFPTLAKQTTPHLFHEILTCDRDFHLFSNFSRSCFLFIIPITLFFQVPSAKCRALFSWTKTTCWFTLCFFKHWWPKVFQTISRSFIRLESQIRAPCRTQNMALGKR